MEIGGWSSQPVWSQNGVSLAWYILTVAELNLADLLKCFRVGSASEEICGDSLI